MTLLSLFTFAVSNLIRVTTLIVTRFEDLSSCLICRRRWYSQNDASNEGPLRCRAHTSPHAYIHARIHTIHPYEQILRKLTAQHAHIMANTISDGIMPSPCARVHMTVPRVPSASSQALPSFHTCGYTSCFHAHVSSMPYKKQFPALTAPMVSHGFSIKSMRRNDWRSRKRLTRAGRGVQAS